MPWLASQLAKNRTREPVKRMPHAVARADRVGVGDAGGDIAVTVNPVADVLELERTASDHAVLNDVRAVDRSGPECIALVCRQLLVRIAASVAAYFRSVGSIVCCASSSVVAAI